MVPLIPESAKYLLDAPVPFILGTTARYTVVIIIHEYFFSKQDEPLPESYYRSYDTPPVIKPNYHPYHIMNPINGLTLHFCLPSPFAEDLASCVGVLRVYAPGERIDGEVTSIPQTAFLRLPDLRTWLPATPELVDMIERTRW